MCNKEQRVSIYLDPDKETILEGDGILIGIIKRVGGLYLVSVEMEGQVKNRLIKL